MPAFADRVKESTTTTGNGTITLDGAATGFQSFTTAFGNGVSVYYVIAGGSEWEIGIGTTGAGTLTRDTVLQSSNADAKVVFSAGTKDVFCSYVADRAVTTVDAATLTNKTISGASNTLSNIGNAALTNSSVTVNGTAISLGSSGTVTAAAGTLTGATLASGVTASSLTSVGTLSALTMGGTLALADNQITRPRFTDYAETYTTPAISSGTLTLNLENGNVFRVSRNANITTLTISNPPASGNAGSFTLIFDANGTSYTITWPAAVKWPGGTAPTITTTNSRSDMFVFYTNNAGTTWYAMTAAQNFVTT
jgi:hypothetical protein